MLAMLCFDASAQNNEQAAVGQAQGAIRRECGAEPGAYRSEVIATPCPGGGTSYVVFFYQPNPCYPNPGPCIQVIQPIGTVTTDCEGNTTVQCSDGFGTPVELE